MSYVEPGTGWPGDLATAATPVAQNASDVLRLAAAPTLDELSARISVCRACPGLVSWREQVADEKRAAFRAEEYWGRPIAGFGPADARIAVVGLAPAARGGNRTGRVFTGDRSGDWLYAAMHRAGLATSPLSVSADDGQELVDTRLVAAVRCAPPANKPTVEERDTCRPWLVSELMMLRPRLRVVVALGSFAWNVVWGTVGELGFPVPRPRPVFGHAVAVLTGELLVVGSYHPSQQNTFTGKLTVPMLDEVFAIAVAHSRADTLA